MDQDKKIPKRVTTAILQSLGAGVVPRIGLHQIAVGRREEIGALLNDLEQVVAHGAASFRLILGRYGSGKSFLSQLIRNYALDRNFVVADADLGPTRRLTGSGGQGLSLYRELLKNLATRTRSEGNAFQPLLERWIDEVQHTVMKDAGVSPDDPAFAAAVERRIHETIRSMEGMVHGFDFASVLNSYWLGHQTGDEMRKTAALRWLRGEFSTKTEAREALGVRVIIDDDTWYDYIKLLALFAKDIGYRGLVVFIDEAVNLFKISNRVAREANYERLLAMFNDTLQGRAQYLAILFSGTPQLVEDRQRGLFSYDALRTRLEESRYARDGLRDLAGPMIRLNQLTAEEIFVLLQRLRHIHALHYGHEPQLNDRQIQDFMNETLRRIGAEQFLTPREVVRDFVAILNLLYQNPTQTVDRLISSPDFRPSRPEDDPEMLTPDSEIHDDPDASPFSKFSI